MELGFDQKNLYRFLVFSVSAIICIFVFFPFLTSIFVAGIFAQVLNPVVLGLQQTRIKNFNFNSKKICTTIVLLFLVLMVSLPFGLVGKKIYGEAVQFSNTEVAKQQLVLKFSKYMGRFETEISNNIKKLGLTRQLTVEDISSGLANKSANLIFDMSAKGLANLPAILINFLIFCAALYFMLAESEKLVEFSKKTGIFSKREVQIVRDSFRISSHAAVVSTILIGLIRGCIVGLGAELVGVADFYIVLVFSFVLSFFPVIGAAAMAIALCATAILAQNYSGALALLGVVLFASIVDNLMRPLFLVYGNHFVHPFVSLLSVLGGMALFGVSGVFIGPVLVQVTFDVLPKLVRMNSSPSPRERIDFKEEVWNSI